MDERSEGVGDVEWHYQPIPGLWIESQKKPWRRRNFSNVLLNGATRLLKTVGAFALRCGMLCILAVFWIPFAWFVGVLTVTFTVGLVRPRLGDMSVGSDLAAVAVGGVVIVCGHLISRWWKRKPTTAPQISTLRAVSSKDAENEPTTLLFRDTAHSDADRISLGVERPLTEAELTQVSRELGKHVQIVQVERLGGNADRVKNSQRWSRRVSAMFSALQERETLLAIVGWFAFALFLFYGATHRHWLRGDDRVQPVSRWSESGEP